MSIADKLITIADNRPKLYKKGASDFGTPFDVSSADLVTINNVHPKEHDVEVNLSSKNLISPSVFENYELQEDGSYYITHDTAFTFHPYELPIGTYTVSYQLKAPANSGYRIRLTDENGAIYDKYIVHTGEYLPCVFSFSNTAKITSIRFYFGNSGDGVYLKDLQIEKGSVATPYTPPIDVLTDIESVTVCGKNLFDISKDTTSPTYHAGLKMTINEDGSFNLIGTLTNVFAYPNYDYTGDNRLSVFCGYTLPVGTTVTLSSYFESDEPTDCIGIVIRREEGFNAAIEIQANASQNGQTKTHTLTNECKTVEYCFRFPNRSAGDYVEIRNIKLQCEIAPIATEWEAFKGGTYPVADGKAIVKSVSPTMNITTHTSGVSIEAKGYLDGQAVIDELTQAIVDLGGEI